jgi:hypothetical protein
MAPGLAFGLALGLTGIGPLSGAAPAAAQTTATLPAPPVAGGASPPPPNGEIGEAGDPEADEIVVTGQRQRGAVIGDIQPDLQLNAADIRALGASSISELLTELGPQLRSGRGRGGDGPVVLVNGKRVSGFREIRNFPPEAIERVDILPEEVALKYGYGANQRVINFVLRQRFRAFTTDTDLTGATDGHRSSVQTEANYLRIRSSSRLSIEGQYNHDDQLLESDRRIVSPVAGRPFDLVGNITAPTAGAEIDPALSALVGRTVTIAGVPAGAANAPPGLGGFGANAANTTDIRPFRSLLPSRDALTLGGSLATTIFGDVGATFSAGLDLARSDSLLGLASASLDLPAGNPFSPFANAVVLRRYAGPDAVLRRRSENWAANAGLALNGSISRWQWSLTATASHAESRTDTDRGLEVSAIQARIDAGDPALNPFGPTALAGTRLQDRVRSNTDQFDTSVVFNGALLPVPAGEISSSVKAQFQTLSLDTGTQQLGTPTPRNSSAALTRTQGNFQGNFDVPLTSVRNDFLAGAGDLSVNFNIAANQLSDFGTQVTYGYGLKWSPIEPISLIASVTQEQGAPTVQQLGNPVQITPNVRVFDFIQGTTVDISRIDGGNPGLTADNRRVFKLGLTLKPFGERVVTLTANYVDERINRPIAAFPTATAELEAAFPERFSRDADGRLLQIDNRPVNFERSDRQELRWGLEFNRAIKPGKADLAAAAERRALFQARARAGGVASGAGGEPTRRPAGDAGSGTTPGPGAGRPPGDNAGGPPGRGGGGGGRGGGGRFGAGPGGNFQLSVYHTWHLQQRVLIRDGLPVLDLLNGSAIGSNGGQPRHEIETRLGINKGGIGLRLSLNWQSPTRVLTDPSGATTAPDDLRFGGLATVDVRLFADLGQQNRLLKLSRFFLGSRIGIVVRNVTNARIDVRDRSGAVPIGYQPDRLDPLGRTVQFTFRKLFF